jgi:hypothetical protein
MCGTYSVEEFSRARYMSAELAASEPSRYVGDIHSHMGMMAEVFTCQCRWSPWQSTVTWHREAGMVGSRWRGRKEQQLTRDLPAWVYTHTSTPSVTDIMQFHLQQTHYRQEEAKVYGFFEYHDTACPAFPGR